MRESLFPLDDSLDLSEVFNYPYFNFHEISYLCSPSFPDMF